MSRKNIPSEKKELEKLITNYEAAKAENRQLYLDGDQLADISDWYASRSKFEEAQEAVTYGLQLHPGNTDLLVEQAYLWTPGTCRKQNRCWIPSPKRMIPK